MIKSLIFFTLIFHSKLGFSTSNPSLFFEIIPIDELSIETSPSIILSKNTSDFCNQKIGAYAITTNGNSKSILGSLNGILPEGMTLSVSLEAPRGASSLGNVTLSQESSVLVSNISRVAQSNLRITYTLHSTKPIREGSYLQTIKFTLSE